MPDRDDKERSDADTEREDLLRSLGAGDELVAELLAYGRPYAEPASPPLLPLPDEPQVADWSEAVDEAKERGAVAALSRRLVQLRFPVHEGMSRDAAYLAASRRGEGPPDEASGPLFEEPAAIRLELHETVAGRLPVIVAAHRSDFETLVRALVGRNEPIAVLPSQGACLVKGLNDWSRVARQRARWESAGSPGGSWDDELARLVPQKELYQDRLVILSSGPYSAVPASVAGMGEREWRERSLALRAAHEATHYFTLRCFGSIRSHLVDELVADWAGCLRALGCYPARLASTFFGLESFPAMRQGGRLEVYRGQLSEGALGLLHALAVRAIASLAALAEERAAELATIEGLARWVYLLVRSTPEDLALGPLESLESRRARLIGFD